MRLIPAIDILGGQCVRLHQGDYQSARSYSSDPVAMAQRFADAGLRYLHVVDLDGARAGQLVNASLLKRICNERDLKVDFGGGIKSEADLQKALDAGVQQVTLGSLAVQQPELVARWLQRYPPEYFILGADFKGGRIATQGWTQQSEWTLQQLLQHYQKLGLRRIIPTDVSRDGTLQGPALDIYRELLKDFPVELIASGGIRDVQHLEALQVMGCYGAIIGKAYYEGHLSLEKLVELQQKFDDT